MSGLAELDRLLCGLRPGDNLVWRVDKVEHYKPFAAAHVEKSIQRDERCVYFRFGMHEPILTPRQGLYIHELKPDAGFETFITQIHSVIKSIEVGGGHFIFDSLSELSEFCYSDRMIGNFFKLTCPYLSDHNAIAYFAMYRYYHSYHATTPIQQTTQILIDIYDYKEKLYIKPFKVDGRFSKTMFRLHEWKERDFVPVNESAFISEIISSSPWPGLPSASYRMIGVWDKVFMDAEETLEDFRNDLVSREKADVVFHSLIRLIMTKDKRLFDLAAAYFSLEDIITIWKRMIGTGMIGGKSIGMLLARAIIRKFDPRWETVLEEHDSFFIASDVFYTFLVNNNCWWDRQRQKNPNTFLDGNADVRSKILKGDFPEYIIVRFAEMLDYFGPSPIIVRSSSLLEDNFGNAFAGKYESVFCANQGTREERLNYFINAVRVIYASTMSDEALSYRKARGVLDKDEQMALLVQRVSGQPYGTWFFPQIAGVGFSFNPYAWNKEIDPEAGLLRIVFGLGTRAVDRSDDDYTRVIALNAPEKRPEANFDEVKRYSQRRVDVIDLESDTFANVHVTDVIKEDGRLPLKFLATRDRELEQRMRSQGMTDVNSWVLTFDSLFKDTAFVTDMREVLKVLKEAYESHVDIEFAANFMPDGSYRINLLQCRPLQIQESREAVTPLPEIADDDILFRATGAIVGHSRMIPIERIVYVVPSTYGKLSEAKRYAAAKVISGITAAGRDKKKHVLFMGPGRWGTSTPSLGIPVSFSQINTASVLCEIDSMHEGLIPDLSLGTHFFNEMVEMNMLYIAYFVNRKENLFNERFFQEAENQLLNLVPDAEDWVNVIKVVDSDSPINGKRIYLNANSMEQRCVLYVR